MKSKVKNVKRKVYKVKKFIRLALSNLPATLRLDWQAGANVFIKRKIYLVD
ncbi:MAG: hypothetical protein KJ666_05535 [Bacteroidetes bacterium]|nr:hypothetical protein [Bacteroidota bacterium]